MRQEMRGARVREDRARKKALKNATVGKVQDQVQVLDVSMQGALGISASERAGVGV
jgi:hypothetical protein